MEYFIPEDSASSNETHLRRARQLTTEPLNTTDDIPFTRHEIQAAREKFDPRKAPGEDAINSEVLFGHLEISLPYLQKYTMNV